LELYRELLRATRQLPRETRQYYRANIRSGFVNHSEEEDPERIAVITARARQDKEWILSKYLTPK